MLKSTKRYLAAVAGAAAMLVPAGITLTGGAASAATTTYVKNGNYQFAANYTDTAGNSVWQVSDNPIAQDGASQHLNVDGVNLNAWGKNYSDSGIIYPLGDLKSLVKNGLPAIVGGSNLAENLYFDTDGNGYYLAFSYNGFYEGPGGDNLGSVSGKTANPTVDFTTFRQGNTCLSGQKSLSDVLATYQAGTCGSNTDPEVWEWIGIGQTDGMFVDSSDVRSVGGTDLVKPPVTSYATGAVKGYAGKCLDNYHSSKVNDTKVDLYSCNGTGAQVWTYDPSTGHLTNKTSGKCLAEYGMSKKEGAKVIQWSCVSTPTEDWAYNSSTREYKLANDGLCLNDPGYSTANGTQQILWACGNYANERYTLP